MKRFSHKNFKYTLRGFLLGVLFMSIVGGICYIATAKEERSTPIVIAEPIIIDEPGDTISPVETIAPIETETVADTMIDDNELEMLAHLLGGEAGADWCEDKMLYYVGSVVLNRVKSAYFPNTIKDVIFQKGQYSCTWDGNYYRTPSERCYRIAEELLTYGSLLPEDVVFQAEFEQGSGVYEKVQNMYFCYR